MSQAGRSPSYRSNRFQGSRHNESSFHDEPSFYYSAPYFGPGYITLLNAANTRDMPHLNGKTNKLVPSRLSYVPEPIEKLPFRKAMMKLHRQLGEAGGFYQKIKDDFGNETNSVQGYADERLLDTLWISKISGKDVSPESEPLHDQFCEMDSNLKKCLQLVKHSVVEPGIQSPPKKQSRQVGAMNRMLEKVQTSGNQIECLLQETLCDADSCADLVTELEKLKALIDPSANEDLYKDNREDTTRSSEGVEFDGVLCSSGRFDL